MELLVAPRIVEKWKYAKEKKKKKERRSFACSCFFLEEIWKFFPMKLISMCSIPIAIPFLKFIEGRERPIYVLLGM